MVVLATPSSLNHADKVENTSKKRQARSKPQENHTNDSRLCKNRI